ncbi:MAG TPA: metallo-beta-lactamase, partial [Gammaproteobacteria bacterium]|nr:metallo-beta-lactamase [Gammaproteobacteria bacterium]
MLKKIIAFVSIFLAASIFAEPNKPFPPFRIMNDVYYVGNDFAANYLITTSQGHILINSGYASDVPMIEESIKKLGFKFSDIKILLVSHSHADHDGGSALIKAKTHAKYMVMAEDVEFSESGGRKDFHYAKDPSKFYDAAKVDHILQDGEKVKLGDVELTAHLTPGHTKGCTTWTMKVKDHDKIYDAMFLGSMNVNPGYQLH